jgi:2-dehydropantoate 2-reductase
VVALAQAMTEADMRAPVRGNIRGEIWAKMINSLCWNPVAVLTGATLGA